MKNLFWLGRYATTDPSSEYSAVSATLYETLYPPTSGFRSKTVASPFWSSVTVFR